jgi:hypothetical protein
MSQTFSVDPNMAVSDSMSPNDPRHPRNILKKTMEVHNQAVADTKYDPPPTRIQEGFTSLPNKGLIYLVFVGILLFLIYARIFKTVRIAYLLVLAVPLVILGYIRNWEVNLV